MKRLFLLEDDLSLINGLTFAVKKEPRTGAAGKIAYFFVVFLRRRARPLSALISGT